MRFGRPTEPISRSRRSGGRRFSRASSSSYRLEGEADFQSTLIHCTLATSSPSFAGDERAGPCGRCVNRPIVATILCTLVACMTSTCLPEIASAQGAAPPELEQYLRRIGLGPKDLAAARDGRAVVKALSTKSNRDVAVFGMIGVRASRDAVVAYALDAESFLAAPGRQFHVFGDPATEVDVREISFEESAYRDLRNCRPGKCVFKLPVSAMSTFVQSVDWSAPDAKAHADQLLRAGLLGLVGDYREGGNAATITYDDRRGVRSGDVIAELAAQSTDLYEHAPELARYLATYPSGRPAGVREFLYWAEERPPRLRRTLTLNHLVVHTTPSPDSRGAFIARKQIYANHYFDGAFEQLVVVDAGAPGSHPGAYLVTVRRFRFDHLPGGLLNIRGRVRSGLVDATRADLERHRASLARRGGA